MNSTSTNENIQTIVSNMSREGMKKLAKDAKIPVGKSRKNTVENITNAIVEGKITMAASFVFHVPYERDGVKLALVSAYSRVDNVLDFI